MTPLNTIIEEEKTNARKTFQMEEMPELEALLTNAMQRAYEAGEREADANWEREFEGMRIPLDVHKNGGILTRKESVVNETLDTLLSKIRS